MKLTPAANELKNTYMREYREKNRERQRAYYQQYRADHKEQVKKYNSDYWERQATAAAQN